MLTVRSRAFRKGLAPIMISTAVSGRGLDIRNVMHVINYDLPGAEYQPHDEYIHRIGRLLPSSFASQANMSSGRTGRAGNQGLATSFYNEQDEHMAPYLAKILVENGWDVPDFLQEYKPADTAELDFDDDSGDEENEPINGAAAAVGDAWGAGGGDASAPVEEETWGSGGGAASAPADDTWGTGNTAAAGSGW